MLTTVGVVVASIGGVVGAVATGMHLYWEASDRLRARREARQRKAIQTYTEAEMRAIVKDETRSFGPRPTLEPRIARWWELVLSPAVISLALILIGVLMIGIDRAL